MSTAELSRLEIMDKLHEKRLTQQCAAQILGLSLRQIKRLYARYKAYGAEGLVSRKRGAPGNNKVSDEVSEYVISLIEQHYHDFGPTLTTEKLAHRHDIHLSVETVRKLMIEGGFWKTRAQKLKRAYQPRARRDCYGELIQIDGSDHDWFEGRAPKCTLLVYIDDATSRLMHLQFVQEESSFAYFDGTKQYLHKHGKPVAYYSDKHSVFRVNKPSQKNSGDKITQFGRALNSLNIDIICANTSQAKGRVERANKTLQDRLVKELRLEGICNMEDGNALLPEFVEHYNEKFGRLPPCDKNLHRELKEDELENIDDVFSWQEERTLSNNLTFQYDKVTYLVEDTLFTRTLKRKRITVYDSLSGIKVKYAGQTLPYRTHFDKCRRIEAGDVVEHKRLGHALKVIKEWQDAEESHRSMSMPSRSFGGEYNLKDKKKVKKRKGAISTLEAR